MRFANFLLLLLTVINVIYLFGHFFNIFHTFPDKIIFLCYNVFNKKFCCKRAEEMIAMKDVVNKIIKIIGDNFPNGIRDDFIDTNKILRIYSESCESKNISGRFISHIIRSNGIEEGGRFYFVSSEGATQIKRLFDDLFETNSILYYSVVCKKNSDFFARQHIFSSEVLRKILQETSGHFYFTDFCTNHKTIRLKYEIEKIFAAGKKLLSFEDLQEKLPYVPKEKISAVLDDSTEYLRTTNGKYISVANLQFDSEELQAAIRQISFNIDTKGFAASADYNLSTNLALNPEVPEKDLRNLIYEKFFAAAFDKFGKKLFKKGASAAKKACGSTKSLRKFIAAQDELSAEKIFDVAQSLGILQRDALHVAHEKKIRVEKNLFVEDSLISFDVAGVDEALSSFVQGKIIPLRSVTSFTGFPSVAGYSWNLFLLESFLRKYSRKYFYAAPTANNSNIGAIYPKSMKFSDYRHVQAAVVVQEKVPLGKSAVENFLVKQGFKSKRFGAEDIISRAQEILSR
jgi:hypothetical protein